MINEPPTTNHELPTRPPSVWIAQVIMGLLAVVWLWAGILGIYYLVLRPGPGSRSALAVASMISSIAFSILFFAGVEGLARRKKYGRWIAVGGLSLVFVGGVLNSFAAFNRYPDPAKALGVFVVGLIVFGPIGFLVYRLARGEQANAFFIPAHHMETEKKQDGQDKQDGRDGSAPPAAAGDRT